MNLPDTRTRVVEILSLVLNRPVMADEAISRENEPRWDSLRHVEVLFAVEAAFDVRFDEDTAAEIRDVNGLVAAVERAHEA